jgi:hypothetical protein
MGNLDRFNAVLFLSLGVLVVLGGLNSFDLECNHKPLLQRFSGGHYYVCEY